MTPDRPQQSLHRSFRLEKEGKFEEARQLLRQAIQEDPSERSLDARLSLGRSLVYAGHDCEKEAAEVLAEARSLAEEHQLPCKMATAIHLLALLECNRRNYDLALSLLDESPAHRLVNAPGREAGELFHYRGLIAFRRGDLAHAERMYFRAYEVYRLSRHTPGIAQVFDSLANLMLRVGKCSRAQAFARRSLRIKRRIKDHHGQAVTLGTLGRTYQLLGKYDEAARAFHRNLNLSRKLGMGRGIGIMLNSLGWTMRLMNHPAKAQDFYEQNLLIDRGPVNAALAWYGLAWVHLDAGKAEQAVLAADRLDAVLGGMPTARGLRAMATGLRGAIARRKGDMKQAEDLVREAVQSLRKLNESIDAIPFIHELRDLLHEQGRTEEAVQELVAAVESLSDCGAEKAVADVEAWLRKVDKDSLVRLTLQRHFPPFLVERVLSGALKEQPGREQNITVLFSDVRGFSTLAERSSPQEVTEIVNEWFREATRAIRAHGGVVDKFIGDAVMALFGVPDERDDAAANAVRAAIAMRDALAAVNLRHRMMGKKQIRIGIGIHTGKAIVGYVGSHLYLSFTVMGDTVNIASRLEGITKNYDGCEILISHSTFEAQAPYRVAETEFKGFEKLKGKTVEVPVYEVRGLRGSRAIS